MGNTPAKRIFKIIAVLTTCIVQPTITVAQVQEVILEKAICVNDRGSVIRFEYEEGVMPPSFSGRAPFAYMIGDTNLLLLSLSPQAAQFLFARACFEVANINLESSQQERLECQTATFLARRKNTRPHEVLQIIEELGNLESTRQIARKLSECL